VWWVIRKEAHPKCNRVSKTLLSRNHQTPHFAQFPDQTLPKESYAWCCASTHTEGIAAGMRAYDPGNRTTCWACQTPRYTYKTTKDPTTKKRIRDKDADGNDQKKANGIPMDHVYPDDECVWMCAVQSDSCTRMSC
jgi:hypothetical protein